MSILFLVIGRGIRTRMLQLPVCCLRQHSFQRGIRQKTFCTLQYMVVHAQYKKGLDFSVKTLKSSAISFRLPPASISAAASSGSPLSSTFVSDVSGPSIPRLTAASFPLSDPRCFRILSNASVLGSDYSASVLPFLLFPVPPHSCFPGARLRSRFRGFPFLSGLISHAFLPGSCTRLR